MIHGNPTFEQGFSRLDLSMALGMVVLMAAVTVPHLNARDRIAGMRCLENQRRLVTAFIMYSDDHSGAMPSVVYVSAGVSRSSRGGGFWPGPIPSFTQGISTAEALVRVKAGLELGSLWTYDPDHSIYNCPDDFRTRRLEFTEGWAYDSYSRVDGLGIGGGWNGIMPIERMAEVPEPSLSIIYVEESDPRGHNFGTWALNLRTDQGGEYGWVDPVAVTHNRSGSFSFVDGHVELHAWRDPATIRAGTLSAQGKPSFYWPGGDLDNPDFRWVLRRYKYRNWQNPL